MVSQEINIVFSQNMRIPFDASLIVQYVYMVGGFVVGAVVVVVVI